MPAPDGAADAPTADIDGDVAPAASPPDGAPALVPPDAAPPNVLEPINDAAPVDLAPARAPDQLGGLVFWFDAAQGVSPAVNGQRVMSWRERSSWQHEARAKRTGPVFLADASKGRPALSFGLTNDDTVALYVADHPSLRWGSQDFTLVAVVRHHNHPGHVDDPRSYGLIYAKVESEVPPYYGPVLWANEPSAMHGVEGPTRTVFRFQTVGLRDSNVTSQADGYDDDNLHLVLGLRRQQRMILRVDGAQAGLNIVPIDNVDVVGSEGVMGANPTRLAQQLEGEIFELAAYRGTTAIEDLEALERHLLDKYRIGAAPGRDR
jgi:hypothetical protein